MRIKRFGILLAMLTVFAFGAVLTGCGGGSKFVKDESVWGITGTGAGAILYASAWSGELTPATTLKNESTETENKYTITLDLFNGDMFKIITEGYANERGYANLNPKDAATFASDNAGGMISDSPNLNIKCLKDGNYTFTFITSPADNKADKSNSVDKINWVRNGNPVDEKVESARAFYIKGDGVTEWQSFYSPYTEFQAVELNKLYKKTIWLKGGTDIMLVSRNTTVSTGAVVDGANIQFGYLRLADYPLVLNSKDAKNNNTGSNIKVKDDGLYTLTLDFTKSVTGVYGQDDSANTSDAELSLTVDKTVARVIEDYYIDGEYGSVEWITGDVSLDAAKKLTKVADSEEKYSIVMTFEADDQFNINGFPTGTAKTGKDMANRTAKYHHDYVMPSKYFSDSNEEDKSGGNIKVKQAGTYVITIDAYSKIVKIVPKTEAGQERYNFIACGPAATGDWNKVLFDAAHTFTYQTAGADSGKYTLTIAMSAGEFNFRGYDDGITYGNATINLGKANYVEGTAASKLDLAGYNLKLTEAGTYKVIIWKDGEAWKLTINTAA